MADHLELLREGAALAEEIAAKTTRLRTIKAELAGVAVFKAGSSTGYVVGEGIRAKIVTGITRKWDQSKLVSVRDHMPEQFGQLFGAKYEPVAKRAIDAALQAGGDLAQALRWAMDETPASPVVTFEYLEGEANGA